MRLRVQGPLRRACWRETAELGDDSSPMRHGYCSSADQLFNWPASGASVWFLHYAFNPALVME